MRKITTDIADLVLIEPEVFGDERGFFMESWNKNKYEELGIKENFVQDNISYSTKGVLRGLHIQHPYSQGKLVTVLQGVVYDVAVDLRIGSMSFGKYFGVELDGKSKRQFYIPPGFAHGFCVLSDSALFTYKCTKLYHPEHEFTLLWNDEAVGIEWPVSNPRLSEKDQNGYLLKDIDPQMLPKFEA